MSDWANTTRSLVVRVPKCPDGDAQKGEGRRKGMIGSQGSDRYNKDKDKDIRITSEQMNRPPVPAVAPVANEHPTAFGPRLRTLANARDAPTQSQSIR